MSLQEWEDKMLALPIAGKVSGEHDEHEEGDSEFKERFDPITLQRKCRCERCIIIRIKRRRAQKFPMTKCPGCGELFFSIYRFCEKCRGEECHRE